MTASLPEGVAITAPYTPSFVDGCGSPRLYPEMFELARTLLAGAVALPLTEIAAALRLLAERAHVIAEGAGALAVAAAMRSAESGPVVSVVSGGNIRADWLSTILSGGIPSV